MDRRLKILWLLPETILDFLRWRQRGRSHGGINLPDFDLPDGCEVRDVCYDWRSHAFAVKLGHPSFEPVAAGEEIPNLESSGPWQWLPIPWPNKMLAAENKRLTELLDELIREQPRLAALRPDQTHETLAAAEAAGRAWDAERDERLEQIFALRRLLDPQPDVIAEG